MALIKWNDVHRPLTISELDGNFTYLEALAQGMTGSTGSVITPAPIDIVYSDLYNLVVTETLEPGAWYRLTDYKSVNYINGSNLANNHFNGNSVQPMDPNFNPYQVHVGDEEILLLHAISNYEIAPISYSETFQGDMLEYDVFTNKIGVDVDIYNGATIPGITNSIANFDLQWDGTNVYFNMPSEIPALFGHYFYLYAEFDNGNSYYQDGNFEPLTPGISVCQYPFTSDDPDFDYGKAMSRLKVSPDGIKIILLDLVEDDYNNYQVGTLQVETVKAIADCYGWVTRRKDTYRNINVPFDFRGQVYRRFQVDIQPPSLNLKYASTGGYFNSEQTTGLYKDFKSLCREGYNSYNIFIDGQGGPDDLRWNRGSYFNNVFNNDIYNVIIKGEFSDNTIDSAVRNSVFSGAVRNNYKDISNFNINVIDNVFNNNIILGSFNNNMLNSFQNNKCSGGFSNNKINSCDNNTFLNSASYNTIDYVSNNTIDFNFTNNIGNNLGNNTIGENFNNNKINTFLANTIGDYFNNNIINGEFSGNTVITNFRNNNILATSIIDTDFTLSSHVYLQYTTTIFEDESLNIKLSYISGSGSLIVVNPNS